MLDALDYTQTMNTLAQGRREKTVYKYIKYILFYKWQSESFLQMYDR